MAAISAASAQIAARPSAVVASHAAHLEFEALQHGWPVAQRFEETSKLASRLLQRRIQRDGLPEALHRLLGAGEFAGQESGAPGQKPSALDGVSSPLERDLQQLEPVAGSPHLLGELHCPPERLGVAGLDLEDAAKMLQGVRGPGEGALQERRQLHPNRNLLGPARPGELGFEQPRQRLGLPQPPVDVPQRARRIPIVGPLRQRLPVRAGGGRVVSAPATARRRRGGTSSLRSRPASHAAAARPHSSIRSSSRSARW